MAAAALTVKRSGAKRKMEDRACRTCKLFFPLTEEYFPKSYRKYVDGTERLRYHCHTCWPKVKPKTTGSARVRARWAKYGLTPEEGRQMFIDQNGRCFRCGIAIPGTATCVPHNDPDIPHIDHDHETGEVRGLSCRSCNLAEGMFKGDAERIMAFARSFQ